MAEGPEKTLYRIGEVSRATGTKAFVLRYWETEIPMLQPVKTPKGHRLYRQKDVETVLEIKRLLYDEGFTIAGARRHLQEQNGGGSSKASPATGGELEHRQATPVKASGERKRLAELREELRAILTLLEGE